MKTVGAANVDQATQTHPSPWRVVGAAVQGTSHVQRGQPCQDAYAYRILPNGALIIAVADGAGSARLSQDGASSAVEAGLLALQGGLEASAPAGMYDWRDILWRAFGAARRAVTQRAKAEGHRSRDYATTLTLVVVTGGWLATGQIGDGVVVVEEDGGRLFAATSAQKGEFANETHFLTQRDAHKHLNVRAWRCPVTALAVMSDGLLRLALKLPAGEPYAPFFQPLFRFMTQDGGVSRQALDGQLAAFLASERVCARSDDDKTLVLAAYAASRALVLRAPVLPDNGSAS